jgi:hypothetical protein
MADARAVEHQIGGPEHDHRADAVIAAVAARQHGVVSRTQLLAAGVTRRQIERRVERKVLRPVYRGVYAAGHGVLSLEGVWTAAVLAAGEDAALSHWSAASLLRLRSGRGPRTHVTCRRARRSNPSITFHRGALPPDEITKENGIPTTTPARTLLDLAALVPTPSLIRMVAAAGPSEEAPVSELLDRYPRKPGAAKLRAIIAKPIAFTRSDLRPPTWSDSREPAYRSRRRTASSRETKSTSPGPTTE